MEKQEAQCSVTRTIQDVIESLNQTYPGAKFSFGYLFNAPCPVERQQWYVFTQVPSGNPPNWQHPFPQRHRFAFQVGGDMTEIYAEAAFSQVFFDWLMRVSKDYRKPSHLAWIEKCEKK